MAKAIYEKRKFTDNDGKNVDYDAYAIQSVVDGEFMELRLKSLSPAEKIAWKMIMTGSNPSDISVSTSRGGDVDVHRESESDEETKNFLDD